MTREKWTQVVNQSWADHIDRCSQLPNVLYNPESYLEARKSAEIQLKELDEAYNVYNMENERK